MSPRRRPVRSTSLPGSTSRRRKRANPFLTLSAQGRPMTDPAPARGKAAGAPSAGAGRLSPASVDATLKLAVVQHQRGELTLAETLYDQVLQIDSANADALHLKGLLTLTRGSAAEALVLIERACALVPRSALFQRSRA